MRAVARCTVGRLLLALAIGLPIGAGCGTSESAEGTIAPAELARRLESGYLPVVLDVRTPEEFAAGHIPGARNIPHDALAGRLEEIEALRQAEIVVHCRSGKRAAVAEGILREAGFERLLDLEGHMQAWQAGGYPIE